VSGRPFQQFIEEEIFAPLGMKESGFMHLRGTQCLAQGYCNRGRPTPAAIIWSGPAGGVISTIADMGRFAAGLLGNLEGMNSRPLLWPETLREMFTDQHRLVALQPDVPASTPAWGLGPGLAPRTFRAEQMPVVHHNGMTQSFRSDLLLLPSKGAAAVVLLAARHEGFPLARLTTQLVRRSLGESVLATVGGQDRDREEEL
jgi:CubicO group peptidase (beta-lactamase class C family)